MKSQRMLLVVILLLLAALIVASYVKAVSDIRNIEERIEDHAESRAHSDVHERLSDVELKVDSLQSIINDLRSQ